MQCDMDVGECRCDNDQQCAAADPGLGCGCKNGLCVRDRGDDVILCDLTRPGGVPDRPDAGVADGGGPDVEFPDRGGMDLAQDSGTGGER